MQNATGFRNFISADSNGILKPNVGRDRYYGRSRNCYGAGTGTHIGDRSDVIPVQAGLP